MSQDGLGRSSSPAPGTRPFLVRASLPASHPDIRAALSREHALGAGAYVALMVERWTRVVIRWRIVVIALWVAAVVVGVLAAGRLPRLLSASLAVPGTGSEQADAILTQHFGENIEGSFTGVWETPRA